MAGFSPLIGLKFFAPAGTMARHAIERDFKPWPTPRTADFPPPNARSARRAPNSPKGADLKKRITSVDGIDSGDLQKKFERLRHESDLDFAERRTFFLSQLKAGVHPDTHPFFMWNSTHVYAPVRESLIHRVRKPRFDRPKLDRELSDGEKAARFGQSVGLSIALASLAGAVVLKTKRAMRPG